MSRIRESLVLAVGIARFVPAAGGPGQSSAPNLLSAVVTLKSRSIIGVLCTDAGNHTEASDIVLSAISG